MAETVSQILIEKVNDWLREQSIQETRMQPILRGCCERLSAAGVPIARVQFSFSVLHPLYSAVGYTWQRDVGLTITGIRHLIEDTDIYLKSPYYQLYKNDLEYLRRRISRDGPVEFPVFEELRANGIRDYLGFRVLFDKEGDRGMVGSWSTDRESGFSESDIDALIKVQQRLAITAKMAVHSELIHSMLSTYLGHDAGERVLSGQTKRGDGETIKAAVVIVDMRDSSHWAEHLGRQGYIDLLNVFFDTLAGAFVEAGGEILSYMGDGFLASFPTGDTPEGRSSACNLAHKAAMEAVLRMQEINEIRGQNDQPLIEFGIGLHIGNVMYGNVGLPDRLTFSVFGGAVNVVSRLEELSKNYDCAIIASEEFSGRCEGNWRLLDKVALRGFDEKMTIFTTEITGKARANWQKEISSGKQRLTDAEHLVQLHRDMSDGKEE